ncbi:MAG: ABC transporter ATP-binding protein [Gammaproteobacteria bacterium]|nr:ABC transporter ATP-binding protein [Gammaproteobacteria bacterium]
MSEILEVRNLVKEYPGITAVAGISFSVEEGSCFGMLGPNGAGKTTTVEIMEGIRSASSGEMLYRGKPIGANFRNEAGMQFQSTALQDHLTVRESLQLFRGLYQHGADLDELIESCSLKQLLDRDNRKLSGGQRQRLLLAIALVNDPTILFLDEPTTGLDPQARRNFWDLIEKIKKRRTTILLTTHYMDEAYILCDTIAIMDHGEIIARGSPESLLKEHFSDVIIELPREDFTVSPASLPWTIHEKIDSVEISVASVSEAVTKLLELGVGIDRIRIRPRNLEDLFLELTGTELRA